MVLPETVTRLSQVLCEVGVQKPYGHAQKAAKSSRCALTRTYKSLYHTMRSASIQLVIMLRSSVIWSVNFVHNRIISLHSCLFLNSLLEQPT